MLTSRFVSTVFCFGLLTLAACDKDESLGEVGSETQGESNSGGDSGTAGETEGESETDFSCPTEAMTCPDGTEVGRSGPDCEFDPCPGEGETDGSDTDDDPPLCAGDSAYQEPAACPSEGDGSPFVIDPGCYVACDTDAPECADGFTCMPIEINPCICDGADCCAACSAGSVMCVPTFTGDACDAFNGTEFTSVEEYECGPGKDGPLSCHWSISFSAGGEYLWSYSDLGQNGGFACKDGVVSVDNAPAMNISYDADSGVLTWDGVEYTQ